MKSSRVPFLLSFLTLLALVFSCEPQVPNTYIQPDVFEDILYDYHLADAMASESDRADDNSYNAFLYRQAVLKKYNVTQADFDSSLVYYMRHSDRLQKIYQNLSDRLGDAALALGASANEINHFGDLENGDTTNIWNGPSCHILMPDAPYNVMTFNIEADTTYHEGDKIIFSFNTDFLFSNGRKSATALLAVQYNGDSIVYRSARISSNMNTTISIPDDEHKGIKSIRGFVYLENTKNTNNKNINQEGNVLRLMFIYNIRLVRMHVNEPVVAKPEATDTVAKKNVADSIQASDGQNNSENKGEPIKFKDAMKEKQEKAIREGNAPSANVPSQPPMKNGGLTPIKVNSQR